MNPIKIKIFILVLLILLSSESFCQKKLTIGFQLGPTKGFPSYSDDGGIYNAVGGSFGANVIFWERNNFLLETGYYKYQIGYVKKLDVLNFNYFGFGGGFEGKLIPLRLQKRINLRKNKIFFTPSLGFSYMKVSSSGSGRIMGAYSIASYQDTLYFSSTSELIRKKLFFQETGFKVEFLILKTLIIDIASYYSFGFAKASQTNVAYHVNYNGNVFLDKVVSRGNNLQIFIGLRAIIIDRERRIEKYKKNTKQNS